MRDIQTMAGSLLLERIWQEGWKIEQSKEFWRYNEKREAANSRLNPDKNINDEKLLPSPTAVAVV